MAAAPYRAWELERKGEDRRPVQAQRRPAMDIRRHAPRFCPVTAAPYRAYEFERKGKDRRPVQAQRRPAMDIRRHAPRFARWRLRLTGPANSTGRGRTVERRPVQAQRRPAMSIRRHAPRFCPVAAAPYRAWELERKGEDRRPVQAQRRPAMGIRRHALRFARWWLRLTGPANSTEGERT
ncbi:hypothetical protein B6J71_04850 [Klebsiella quasipneumoniae]|nr:hypothetical protein B6J71_04850 [Klebsiella quasipneumoniae]